MYSSWSLLIAALAKIELPCALLAGDEAGFVSGAIDQFNAYRKNRGQAELHIFQTAPTASSTTAAAPTNSWTASKNGCK